MTKKFEINVTNIIIAITVIIYLYGTISGNQRLFIFKFGLNSPVTKDYITYLSSAFIHGGITHVGFNMYFLYIFGPFLERYIGSVKFAIYYLVCAIVSGFMTTYFSSALTVGASGVLYAIMTTIIVISRSNTGKVMYLNSQRLINLLIINILLSFMIPGVSIIGHLSGIVTGILAAVIIMIIEEKKYG